MSDVMVVTREPMDFGQGPHFLTQFPAATHHIDPSGHLHVRSTIEGRGNANVAAFGPGEWRAVITAAFRVTSVTVETIGDANATLIETEVPK